MQYVDNNPIAVGCLASSAPRTALTLRQLSLKLKQMLWDSTSALPLSKTTQISATFHPPRCDFVNLCEALEKSMSLAAFNVTTRLCKDIQSLLAVLLIYLFTSRILFFLLWKYLWPHYPLRCHGEAIQVLTGRSPTGFSICEGKKACGKCQTLNRL